MNQHSAASVEESTKRRAALLNRQRRCLMVFGREESLDELPASRASQPGPGVSAGPEAGHVRYW